MHGLFYSSEPEAARAFIRDKLKLPYTDTGGGWLIFDLPEAELGIHPSEGKDSSITGTHDVSFYCDNIKATAAELAKRGVHFTGDIADYEYGYVTYFAIPGGIKVQLYQPKYRKPKVLLKSRVGSAKPHKKTARRKTP